MRSQTVKTFSGRLRSGCHVLQKCAGVSEQPRNVGSFKLAAWSHEATNVVLVSHCFDRLLGVSGRTADKRFEHG